MLLFVSWYYLNEIMLSIDFVAALSYQFFSAHNALRMHMIFLHNTFFWNNMCWYCLCLSFGCALWQGAMIS